MTGSVVTPEHEKLLEQFSRALVGAHRAPRTVAAYVNIARSFLLSLHDRAPMRRDVDAFLADPLKNHGYPAPSTRNQALAGLRALATWALDEEVWRLDPTRGVRFLKLRRRERSVLFSPQVRHLFREIPKVSFGGEVARDRAILGLEYGLGLRVSEVHHLDLEQVDLTNRCLLGVRRKGGRVQNLYLGDRLVALLADHIEQRRLIAPPGQRALFLSRKGARASVRTLQRLTERLRNYLGLHTLVSHDGRHAFVSNTLAEGGDLFCVSRFVGHESIQTTQAYAHVADPLYRRVPIIAESAMIPLDAIPEDKARVLRERQQAFGSCPTCGCTKVHLGAADELRRELKGLDADQALDDAA
jgi:site-specific recombinase XerD